VVVEEGPKPVLGIFGSRPVVPARKLDPALFTSLDRLRDRTIQLPEGQYSLVSRQDLAFATPAERKEDRVAGTLQINAPEKFWEPSKFLVLVRR
jgi:hypothetical protein